MRASEQRINLLFNYSFALLMPILKNISLKIVKQIRNPDNIPVITEFQDSTAFINLTTQMMITGYFLGQYEHQLMMTIQIDQNRTDFAEDRFSMESGFAGAKEFFIKKDVTDIETYNRLTNTAKEGAFSVAKITDLQTTEKLKGLIEDAIEEGIDLKTFQQNVDELVAKTGITPLSPHYMELVYRNNLFSTYNIGNKRGGLDDSNTVSFRYIAVGDNRTRPTHAQLDGLVAKKNDPIWNDITPPIDHQCRCSIQSISQHFLDNQKGLIKGRVSKTDINNAVGEDFGKSPTTLKGYNTLLEKEFSDLKKSVRKAA
jgi:SPP1 gp7 family putative phage head morphogenesis protein